ncbi:DUF1467 family protein [Oceanicella actignis]|uniref:DUF1467 family protein n=1 Tax=Oceanicella actignis TaxID=1189325 RepID=UPI0011E69759|nr:DUF1467 family protein [Oceanicella actignis]TYO89467.1 putative secreted protein [Oceanicella actignis]
MTITAAIVLYAVSWFMTLFVILPLGMRSQQDEGDVAPGTPASAPADPQMRRKFRNTTIVATLIWIVLMVVITTRMVTLDDIFAYGPTGAY